MKGNFASVPVNPRKVDTKMKKSIEQVFLAAFAAGLGQRIRKPKRVLLPSWNHPRQGAQECERRRTPGTEAYKGGGGLGWMVRARKSA